MKIQDLDKFPKDQHFAALVFKTDSVYHEGEQRSQDCPGHGYSSYTETIKTVDYIFFASAKDRDDWIVKTETSEYTYGNKKPMYKIVEVIPLTPKIVASIQY